MAKRILSLYIEDEYIEEAKARRINLSQLFNEFIKTTVAMKDIENVGDEQIINELKLRISELKKELADIILERDRLQKQVGELDGKIDDRRKNTVRFKL